MRGHSARLRPTVRGAREARRGYTVRGPEPTPDHPRGDQHAHDVAQPVATVGRAQVGRAIQHGRAHGRAGPAAWPRAARCPNPTARRRTRRRRRGRPGRPPRRAPRPRARPARRSSAAGPARSAAAGPAAACAAATRVRAPGRRCGRRTRTRAPTPWRRRSVPRRRPQHRDRVGHVLQQLHGHDRVERPRRRIDGVPDQELRLGHVQRPPRRRQPRRGRRP